MKDFYKKIKAELNLRDATLIAVSKKQPVYKINKAKELGITHFGENYIQEALNKINKGAFLGCTTHFIGHLQTNKTKDAVTHFDFIHSVDRLKLIKNIDKEAKKLGKIQNIFIHVKTHQDDNKSGCSLNEVEDLILYIKDNCPHIHLCGFMCIPPLQIKPEESFKIIAELMEKHQLKDASMGMSGDYKEALKHGATFVRVGTALFGDRS